MQINSFSTILAICTILFVLSAHTAAAECVVEKIMPLGDSITAGVSAGVADEDLVGYRKFLYDDLVASSNVVDFVGGEVWGWAVPGFDSNNEGHGGFKNAALSQNVYQWLVDNSAEYVLLHSGTNRTNDITREIADFAALLDEIDRYEADSGATVTVIIAKIIKVGRSSDSATEQYNLSLVNLVNQRINIGDDLVLVDMENALVYPVDYSDTLHPNASGYAKMAGVWKAALSPLLTVCSVPDLTPPSQPIGLAGNSIGYDAVNLVWTPSIDTDGSGWVGYRVYRDGIEIGTTSLTGFSDIGLQQDTTYVYTVEAYDAVGNVSLASLPVSVSTVSQVASLLRINAGGGAYTDSNGNPWLADFGFNAGNVATTGSVISGTGDASLYQSMRWDDNATPELRYGFGVANGVYQVSLYFAESFVNGTGQRVFDVEMEGVLVMNDVDIYAESGGKNIALKRTVQVSVLDGELTIQFLHQVENPVINAIEAIRIGDVVADGIAPSQPSGLIGTAAGANQIDLTWSASTDTGGSGLVGYRVYRDGIEVGTTTVASYSDSGLVADTQYSYTVEAYDGAGNVSIQSTAVLVATLSQGSAIRINAGGGAYTDSNGNPWLADFGFNAGNVATTGSVISGTGDASLYQSMRWDDNATPELRYGFGVANGVYQVSLYFAESFVNGTGQRVFDVEMEGVLVMNDVDIYAESGGKNIALKRTVQVSVLDGELTIQFLHQVENPVINAIEIIAQ